jgi:hypothetical protein
VYYPKLSICNNNSRHSPTELDGIGDPFGTLEAGVVVACANDKLESRNIY